MAATTHPKVWLITGCSSGFGREFALAALARGNKVVATARDASKLEDLRQRGARTLSLNVRASDEELRAQIDGALEDVGGRLDILVNNAGYVLEGGVEECADDEARGLFDTNVFGVLSMLRAVLPRMREQKAGVVANMGSLAGWRASPSMGIYSASKFAVAALSMALKAEVAHLGIDVVCIEPGNFRTNVLGSRKATPSKGIDELQPAVQPPRKHHEEISGQQPGDPAKAARLVAEMLTKSDRFSGTKALPARFPLGRDAIQSIRETMERSSEELDEWQALAASTGFDDP